ncbi:MAG: formyltransferase [Synergistaceae bacterium]|nr:formyltransferase [Synergistota bacterium]NLM70489.1 formyltransferase [Synergistaceae bacterium]
MIDLSAAVFAYSEVGHVCLAEMLRQGAEVRVLFTHEDDPAENRWFPSVAEPAREAGIPVRTPEALGDAEYDLLRELAPDAIFSFYYRSMIDERFLSLPPKGAFNMHGSLLPRYRGRACVNWAILNGETETGATLHHMVRRADAGDIVDQEAVPILMDDTALDVTHKVAEAARTILGRTLPLIADGTAPRTPQDESKATLFGRRRPEDGLIDWNDGAVRVHNLVRAVTSPFPGAFTFHRGKKLFVWRTSVEAPLKPLDDAQPGAVLSIDPLRVATGLGALLIHDYELDGGDIRTGDILRASAR